MFPTPEIEALANRALAAAQALMQQSKPGVPIDYESPQVKSMLDMLKELEGVVKKQEAAINEAAKASAEDMKKDLAVLEKEQKLREMPPLERAKFRLADHPLGWITFHFKKDHSPKDDAMHPLVHDLLQLAKSDASGELPK